MSKNRCNIQEFEELLENPIPYRVAYSIKPLHDIVHNPKCDEALKQNCINRVIEKIVWLNECGCVVDFLYNLVDSLSSCFERQDKRSKSIVEFARQIVNHPAVVESYVNAHTDRRHHFFVEKIAEGIGSLFTDETALKVLQNNPNKDIFVIFGYHPVLLKYVHLQKRWICYYSKYKKIEPIFGIRHITDEALLSVPVEDAFNFIKKIFLPWNAQDLIQNMLYLKLETIKRITFVYIAAHGMDKDVNYVIRGIKKVEELQSK